MQLDSDDSKHKVYIYDLDAELSDSGESDDGRLVFLPDIEKHLLQNRIPAAVLANKEGELAGMNIQDMQMVLYSEPTSLSVSQEHDSVRKAVLEARARLRRRQKGELEDDAEAGERTPSVAKSSGPVTRSQSSLLKTRTGLRNLANDPTNNTTMTTTMTTTTNGHVWAAAAGIGHDPDEMEID